MAFNGSKAAEIKMTEGPYRRQIILFAIPLFLGNLFQQLYNTADTLIVGKLLGDNALAGVTASGSLIFMLVGFFGGISMGAGVVISRYFGAGEKEKVRRAMHTCITFFTVAGVVFSVAGSAASGWILHLMKTPDDVFSEAQAYAGTYFAGMFSMVIYNACMCIMQALGDSKHPLYYLIISSVTNIALDLFFIGVLHLGVGSAALATVISQCLSVALCLKRLMSSRTDYRIKLKELGIDWHMLGKIIEYGLPSGLQNSIISIANVVVQSNINIFGPEAMAGCGAYSKIEGFAFIPVTCFTAAITTFVGQNLGAGNVKRAKKGARFGIFTAIIIAESIGGIIYLLAPHIISLFVEGEQAIAFGVDKSRICSVFFFLCALCHCFASVMRGAGKAIVPMFSMAICWCVIRVSILYFAVPRLGTIDIVNWVYPITWFLCAVTLAVYYFTADWAGTNKKEKNHNEE